MGNALGVAAGNYYFAPGIVAPNASNCGPGVLFGGSCYSAGIEHYELCASRTLCPGEALFPKLLFDRRAVRLSSSTTEIFYVKAGHPTILAYVDRKVLPKPLIDLQFVFEAIMKRKILLVDDDATVLLTLKAVLELNQFDVQTATSAAEGIEKLISGEYDMVITDSRMETDDAGFHVIRAARQQRYNPATALLTAYPPRNMEGKQNSAQSVLVKPIGTKDLLRQIEALLVQHQDEKQSRARPGTLRRCVPLRRNKRPASCDRPQTPRYSSLRVQALAAWRRSRKHSRQNTGRP